MQSTEIGHFVIKAYGNEFSLIPSLENMSKLADPKGLIRIYNLIHSKGAPINILVDLARQIILTCSSSDEIGDYLVWIKRGKPQLKKRMLSMNDQVAIAAGLMRHGIAGVNRPKMKGDKKKGKALDKFDVNRIVADIMVNFNMSRKEALQLTMSEIYQLIGAANRPDEQDADLPSVDEHISLMERIKQASEEGAK